MKYEDFITIVKERAHIPDEEAQKVSCLTLKQLAHRISAGEAEDLAGRLPENLRQCIEPETPVEKFHADEFLRRIEQNMGVDHAKAVEETEAVLVALFAAVGPDEFAEMRSELPKDFNPIIDEALASAPPPEQLQDVAFAGNLAFDEILDRVMQRAGIDDRDRARRAVEAVLEVLAWRVTKGQAEDLKPFLPAELRPAVDRGVARAARAVPLSVGEFLEEVARLEKVNRGTATQHVRAVLPVLREAVGDKEFHDTMQQLPSDYDIVLRQG
jgi:uncharacterized protein (DUF2267 family)